MTLNTRTATDPKTTPTTGTDVTVPSQGDISAAQATFDACRRAAEQTTLPERDEIERMMASVLEENGRAVGFVYVLSVRSVAVAFGTCSAEDPSAPLDMAVSINPDLPLGPQIARALNAAPAVAAQPRAARALERNPALLAQIQALRPGNEIAEKVARVAAEDFVFLTDVITTQRPLDSEVRLKIIECVAQEWRRNPWCAEQALLVAALSPEAPIQEQAQVGLRRLQHKQ